MSDKDKPEEQTQENSERLKRNLHLANIYVSRNKVPEALALYNLIVAEEPKCTEAHVGIGLCLKLQGKTQEAIEKILEALSINKSDSLAYNTLGVICKDNKNLVEAIEMYKKALECDPNFIVAKENLSVALTDLGTHMKVERKQIHEGLKCYQEALEYNPRYAPAYYNIGVVYSELQDFEAALENYSKAVSLNPLYCEAYCNLGVIYKKQGELEKSIEQYLKAISVNPNFSIARHNLAIAYTDFGTKTKNEGDIRTGIRLYKRGLQYNYQYSDSYYNLGVAYGEQAKYEKAIYYYELAIHFNSRCTPAYNNLGVIYKNLDNLPKAIQCYSAALQINPKFSQTLNNISVIYVVQGKIEEAYVTLKAAIDENPKYIEAYNTLGVLYRDECEIKSSVACYEKCMEIDPSSRFGNPGQNRLLALNYLEDLNINDIYEAHRSWGEEYQAEFPVVTKYKVSRDPNKKLRIGYISPDFFVHSVSYFIEAILKHHHRESFHITCYSSVVRPDHKTERLKSYVDSWKHVTGFLTQQVVNMIVEDEIDILVELAGHTANNRLDVVACKPAPIQITWIGYPNTTGLSRVDYRFTDAVVDPPNTTQKYTEKLIRLPNVFLCYTPAEGVGDPVPLPVLQNGFITFGSFNNLAKINLKVCEVWAKILKALPSSRLVVKSKTFVSEKVRQKFWSIFEKFGVLSPVSRIDLMGLIPFHEHHLASYGLMDMSLDTFPYAGTTTTMESLYMGVPVITLRTNYPEDTTGWRDCHACNVGVTLLTAIECERCIADSLEEYIQKALELASDVPRLVGYRKTLREKMISSYICNGEEFTTNVEGVYRDLWKNYVNSDTR